MGFQFECAHSLWLIPRLTPTPPTSENKRRVFKQLACPHRLRYMILNELFSDM
jgi:hypothetical protein